MNRKRKAVLDTKRREVVIVGAVLLIPTRIVERL
jgi:hypothetical protein